MRLTKHAKVEISAAMLFLLASCNSDGNKFSDAQLDEITDVAGDAAGDAIADDEKILELEQSIEEKDEKIQQIERRIDEIEQRLTM